MDITDRLLTVNKYSRPGTPIKRVKGVVVHWVENPRTSAIANRAYFEGLKDQPAGLAAYQYASAHYIVGLAGEVIRCVPDGEVCYHVGAETYKAEALRRLSSYPNNCTIGVELCHMKMDGEFTEATLQSCRELISFLLMTHGLDREDIWRHFDVTGKNCPKYFVEHTDEWETFKGSI
jgi:N-acetylmuramoyl-L-alanine amidase